MTLRPPPCAREVAEAALELDPSSLIVAYLRAQPGVGWWMAHLEARRMFEELLRSGAPLVEARRQVAGHVGVHERTLRRRGFAGHLLPPLSNEDP